MNSHNFGTTLKHIRLKRGLSQKELAEGICSPKFVYMIEAGKRAP